MTAVTPDLERGEGDNTQLGGKDDSCNTRLGGGAIGDKTYSKGKERQEITPNLRRRMAGEKNPDGEQHNRGRHPNRGEG
jgi:hypothetical protein